MADPTVCVETIFLVSDIRGKYATRVFVQCFLMTQNHVNVDIFYNRALWSPRPTIGHQFLRVFSYIE